MAAACIIVALLCAIFAWAVGLSAAGSFGRGDRLAGWLGVALVATLVSAAALNVWSVFGYA